MRDIAKRAEEQLKKNWTSPIDTRGKSYFVDPPAGRRLAISDIHGSFQTFTDLLKKIDLQKEDQLFLLGDFIDRGPYSFLVLAKVWQLLAEGYQILPLRGNHEQLFLNYNRENWKKLQGFAERQNALHLLRGAGELKPYIDHFFSILPYYYETDKAYLVHAGFDVRQKDPFTEWKEMLWLRNFRYDARKLKDKRVIHGHVPTEWDAIKRAVANDKGKIGIDNACVRAAYPGFGRLVCFDFDSKKLISKKNEDAFPMT